MSDHHPTAGSARSASNAHAASEEGGFALILGLFFAVVVTGITVSGTLVLRAHRQSTETSFQTRGQAMSFARSGLNDALGWFRKQTSQPVTTFAPELDAAADPPKLDTDDEDLGIVREFQITGAVWGRYEVWKEWDTDPDATRLAWRQQMEAEDVSTARGGRTAGEVWRIRSIGYVWRRIDPTKAYNEQPNYVLGQQVLETEVRRLALSPPGQAAACMATGSQFTGSGNAVVDGGSVAAGIFYDGNTSAPTTSGKVSGSPGVSAATDYAGSIEDVFGVTQDQLQSMADYVVSSASDLPDPMPNNAVIYATGDLTFTASLPLQGTGILFVSDDLVIEAGTASNFSGLIYVVDDLHVNAPAEIKGAVVVGDILNVSGGSDFATVVYDDDVLNSLRQAVGNYRYSAPISRPLASDQ